MHIVSAKLLTHGEDASKALWNELQQISEGEHAHDPATMLYNPERLQ